MYGHFIESSAEEDYVDETMMMWVVLADGEHVKEHVLNSKGSIKGRSVLNRKRALDTDA